ncbi:sigma-70 family RNA polymerase sigma factor [Enterococcus thailandicus]|nr:sigma-70 family RNA polymerase sigma factor [Enterococcus thailandicus]
MFLKSTSVGGGEMEEIENELFYQRLKKRDDDAFDYLITAYSKLLWAVGARSGVHNNMDLEEIISDVFLRFWQHPEKFNPEKGSLKTYLCIMTKSMTRNKWQKVQKFKQEPLTEINEDAQQLISDELDEKEAWQELYNLILTFDEPTRQLLFWRIFCDLSPLEIAERTKLTSKEIDNYLYRGRKKLRHLVNENSFFREVENR